LDLNTFLVGNILGVANEDLYVMAVLSGVILVGTMFFFAELRFVAYDPEMAAASGAPVSLVQAGLLVLIALAAVVAFRLVGVVMALAMLVAPAAAAAMLFQQITRIMLASTGLGFLAVVVGLYASFHADVAAGPAIVLSSVALFVVVYAVSPRGLRHRRRGPIASSDPTLH
jgi:manganese/iron transport system permease protein